MKVLIFNGTLSKTNDTSEQIAYYLKSQLIQMGTEAVIYQLLEHQILLFDISLEDCPEEVQEMVNLFRSCDKQIWLTPLYHGGMVGAMKNCLDWLILNAKEESPYLTNKIIALVCWAYGGNAATGIDSLRTIVATLRAWALPYSIPIVREDLYEKENKVFSITYKEKFQRLNELLIKVTLPE